MKLDENWLIYQFHTNLESEFSSYFERYSQDHDPFTEQGTAEHSLSSAMQHFMNTARNPSSENVTSKPNTGIASYNSSVAFVAPHLPANQVVVQAGAKPGTNQARVITLTKTVKYCTHCKRDYHTEAECHEKNPHLREAKSKSTKPNSKRRRRDKGPDHATSENEAASFIIQPQRASFLSAPLEMTLSKIWIWESRTSPHSCHDCNLFSQFKPLTNKSPVKGLGRKIAPQGIGAIKVPCKGKNGQLTYLLLEKVLFMSGSRVNLMSEGQLQREGCPPAIVKEGIEIGEHKVLARLVNNNLYIPDLADSIFPPTALAAINQDTLQLWHSRLGHLGKQNVLRLTTMSKGIDLSKSPPNDACIPCAKTGMKVETHKDHIQPGRAPLDPIYSDVHGPFPC